MSVLDRSPELATPCPHCGTRITLGRGLLRADAARVRCGACLKLFSPGVTTTGDDAVSEVDSIRARALNTVFDDGASALDPMPSGRAPAVAVEPLELPTRRRRTWVDRVRTLSALGAIVGLMLALAAQYFWANRRLYQHSPSLYPWYVTGCEVFNCSVPAFVDIAALRGEKLSISAAQDRPGSLIVRFDLVNRAPLAQSAPVLILSFDTAAKRSVALREFAPQDYFPASHASSRPLAAGERVPISLALIDPGADAVNYTLAFRAP